MILWDHTFSTDRALEHSRTDLVFENKRTKEEIIVETGICLDQKLKKKLEALILCLLFKWYVTYLIGY